MWGYINNKIFFSLTDLKKNIYNLFSFYLLVPLTVHCGFTEANTVATEKFMWHNGTEIVSIVSLMVINWDVHNKTGREQTLCITVLENVHLLHVTARF